jgi:hypothetical protein
MGRAGTPVTPAVRALRAAGFSFTAHLHDYEERGGTAVLARELGVDENGVVKTLVMEGALRRSLVVLMHGDMQISRKEPARVLGVKGVHPCGPDEAGQHSGCKVQGTWRRSDVYSEHGKYMLWPTRASGPMGGLVPLANRAPTWTAAGEARVDRHDGGGFFTRWWLTPGAGPTQYAP